MIVRSAHRAFLIRLCRFLLAAPTALLLGCTSAHAQGVERKTLFIPQATQPIAVDGDLKEWTLPSADTQVPQVGVIRLDAEEEDFSGQTWLRWTETFLYAAFRIADSSPMKNSGDDPFMAFKSGDTVELFLCTDPQADPNRVEPGPNDYRIIMTALRKEPPIVFAYHPVGTGEPKYVTHPTGAWRTRMDESALIPDARFALNVNKAGDGYTAEVAIPWSFFPRFAPQPGMRIPFNWALNFSDAAGQKNVMKLWWNGPNTMCTDIPSEMRLNTATWGWAVFGG